MSITTVTMYRGEYFSYMDDRCVTLCHTHPNLDTIDKILDVFRGHLTSAEIQYLQGLLERTKLCAGKIDTLSKNQIDTDKSKHLSEEWEGDQKVIERIQKILELFGRKEELKK